MTRSVQVSQEKMSEHQLEDKIILSGSLCIGKCNRVGVTVKLDEEVHVGITPENFEEFFNHNILNKLTGE